MSQAQLGSLPDDVLLHVASNLSTEDILALRRVSLVQTRSDSKLTWIFIDMPGAGQIYEAQTRMVHDS